MHEVRCKSQALGSNWETVHLCCKVGNGSEAREGKSMGIFWAQISELWIEKRALFYPTIEREKRVSFGISSSVVISSF